LLTKSEALSLLTHSIDHCDSIDDITCRFTQKLKDCTHKVFKQKHYRKPLHKQRKSSPWFNAECNNARISFKRTRNTFQRNKTNDNRRQFINARSHYNRIKKLCRNKYKAKEKRELTNLGISKPNEF
jgi:hypothetical protein